MHHCSLRPPWEAGKVVFKISLWSQEVLSQGVGTEGTTIKVLCVRLSIRHLNMLSQLMLMVSLWRRNRYFLWALGLREGESLTQGHTARRWQIWIKILDCSVYGYLIILPKLTVQEPGWWTHSISLAWECISRSLPYIFNNWYEHAISRQPASCLL